MAVQIEQPYFFNFMDIEFFREYCLSKPETEECLPFDENTLVFKVCGKMFALTDLASVEFSVNLKSDPEKAVELRAEYDEVQPGYHMNKKHWNTVLFDGRIPDKILTKMIDDSYILVLKSLKKSDKERIIAQLKHDQQ
jgi:predicted DNA-binding protein (MmcQ/YjbR family)